MQRLTLLIVALTLGLAAWTSEPAQAAQSGSYFISSTMRLPAGMKPLSSFDIGWVDPTTDTYVFTDKTNGTIDVFDALKNQYLFSVPGFVGSPAGAGLPGMGPNGIVIVPDGHGGRGIAWAGDGDGSVKVADLNTGKIIGSVSTGAKFRADEVAYDPIHHLVLFGYDADSPVYLAFISTIAPYPVLGTILYDGQSGPGHAPKATDGIEQPIYDPVTGHFFQAVPATVTNPGGEIDEIDPVTMQVIASIVTTCRPTGLMLGPNHQALANCGGNIAIDLGTHKIIATIPQGGGDEGWYNPSDHHYYTASLGGGGTLHIIDADTNSWIGDVMTGGGAHSVAADLHNNEIFVPLGIARDDPSRTDNGILVITQRTSSGATKPAVTFDVVANGGEESPPVVFDGTVKAHFSFDSTSQELSWSLEVSGFPADQITAATISKGARGETGSVVYTLSTAGLPTRSGKVTLNSRNVVDLQAGNLFLNLTSKDIKGGFARAQLTLPNP